MKKLVVYDSFFGNTEKIAHTIARTIGSEEWAIKISDIKEEHFDGIETLIVGSPTRAFNPTKDINQLLKSLPKKSLDGVKVAAFDTRADIKAINAKILTFMVNLFGYAAEKIEKKLAKKGGTITTPAQGFYVNDKEGPLVDGEEERAEDWAKSIINE
jgi:flavodoxin